MRRKRLFLSLAKQSAVEVGLDLGDLPVPNAEAQGNRHFGPVRPKVVGELAAPLPVDDGVMGADAIDGLPLKEGDHLADAFSGRLR